MPHLTVSPAYGRDYKTSDKALADWKAGKDFIIETFTNPYYGKPVNLEDAEGAGIKEVNIRFNRLSEVIVVKVS